MQNQRHKEIEGRLWLTQVEVYDRLVEYAEPQCRIVGIE